MTDQLSGYFKFRDDAFTIHTLKDNQGFKDFLNKPELIAAINNNYFVAAFSLAVRYGYVRSLMITLLKAGINPLLYMRSLVQEAFESSKYIAEITLPDNIERIDAHAFQNSWVNVIHIPKSIEYIGQQAFADMHRDAGDVMIEYDGSAGDWNDIEFGRDVFQNSRGTIYCLTSKERIEFGG